MIQTSFSEKLKILVDVSSSSGICIASIFLLIFMAYLFITTNKKNAVSSKKLYISIYIILLIIIVIQYYSSLSNMFDYMMNNFFIGFYFPNLAIYLAAIIITNIILWKTIFNFKIDKILKYINTIIYCILHYLLILILNIVAKNNIDVFDQISVYKNTNIAALIGLSSTIFIVWIIFITVYNIIRKNQKKHQKVKVPIRRVIRYKKKLPENYKSKEVPKTLIGIPGKVQGTYIESNLLDFYKINEQQDELSKYESMFTLDDYKRMVKILKSSEQQDFYETECDNKKADIIESSSQEDNLEVKDKDEEIPQPKLEELLNLYKSI